VVYVPNEVTNASHLLAGNGTELLYNPSGLPTGNSPPDPIPGIPGPFANFNINQTFPPGAGLVPGQPYYLGVRNINPNQNNYFELQVDFNIPITLLTLNQPLIGRQIQPNPYRHLAYTTPIAAITNMDYYAFDIPDRSHQSAMIKVKPSGGDINLVLRRALCAVDLFPHPTHFDYQATLPGNGTDLIIINSNSIPVRLWPGRWYLGVYNVDSNRVDYSISVETSTTGIVYNQIDLTDGSPVPFLVPPANQITNFYRFIVDKTNAAVLFEIYGLNEDADLMARRSDLPSRDLYDFGFLNIFDPDNFNFSYEPIPLRTNIFIPHVNATNWFLAVANRSGDFTGTIQDVSGWVCAKTFTNQNPIIGCIFNAKAYVDTNGTITIAWDSVAGTTYEVQITSDFVNWSQVSPPIPGTGGVDTYVDMTPVQAGEFRFYRIRAY
jgi:hypothetical protein